MRPRFDPVGTASRRAALRVLDAVLRRGQPIETGLARAGDGLAPADRGLAHAIAAEALRWLADLDTLIDRATRQRLPDDAKARFALRIALVQALRLGTPPHAAIATVLPLVDGGPRKLVHGVFGALMRGGAALPELPTLPAEVAVRWQQAHGAAMVEAARAAIAAPPPVDLTLADPAATDEWATRLSGISLMPGHVRLPAGADVPALPGFADGGWWVQDLAAGIPARLLGAGGGHVLDLCAAPGGKTMQLAAAGWDVTAVDISEQRLVRLRENLDRTRQSATLVAADVARWTPDTSADAVLIDAPCSATGIFRRHPDVLHRAHPRLIEETAALQTSILSRAADWVRPGGRIVYAVCSLEPVEGEGQLARFLGSRDDYAIEPITADELPAGIMPRDDGTLRTLPAMLGDQGRIDGFFIARLRRRP
ncbi:RsmB/NOP family class I SAM-dependent RNA methyltransferase [Sphingomonas sp.]|uniref:RsmB/NOP family class I SAM-dependent RNA methyltransferase n=1 Tax=Sphingomonas sp. TaxID=28214 RepID=UPI002C2087DE|nr:RsmB/NOP family class I SAM-dependent RNA methyltransferase [Sphingomonas sp.]HTG39148.1 RsmB/NOP family class I SAM-dependent RNA methyltransferase [Sphingomonas sp.]